MSIATIAAVGAGAYLANKVWACSNDDVKLRWSEFSGLIGLFTAQVQRASSSEKLTQVLRDRVNALSVRVAEAGGKAQLSDTAAKNTLGRSTASCDALDFINAVQLEAHKLSADVGALIGEESVVPAPPSTTMEKLLWVGVAAAGVYFGYKLVRSLAHGDTIPRHKLPRYAGGTRGSR